MNNKEELELVVEKIIIVLNKVKGKNYTSGMKGDSTNNVKIISIVEKIITALNKVKEKEYSAEIKLSDLEEILTWITEDEMETFMNYNTGLPCLPNIELYLKITNILNEKGYTNIIL